MTKSKIAITLPRDQLARVHREVRAGRAASVSGFIAQALSQQQRGESLAELVQDLVKEHGAPSAKDIKWAERALP
jgi:Arc/MetJ-type ribon-helix-helix transcriptional regulator